MFDEVVTAGCVRLLLVVYDRSLRMWWVHGRCAHGMRYVGDDGLCHVKKLSRIDVHVADATTCCINSWGLWLDEGRRSAIVVGAMVRGVGYSDQGSVDGRQTRAG
jgi:hypothetical protein